MTRHSRQRQPWVAACVVRGCGISEARKLDQIMDTGQHETPFLNPRLALEQGSLLGALGREGQLGQCARPVSARDLTGFSFTRSSPTLVVAICPSLESKKWKVPKELICKSKVVWLFNSTMKPMPPSLAFQSPDYSCICCSPVSYSTDTLVT